MKAEEDALKLARFSYGTEQGKDYQERLRPERRPRVTRRGQSPMMVIEPEDKDNQTEEVVHVQTVPQRGKRATRKEELALAQIEVERRLAELT